MHRKGFPSRLAQSACLLKASGCNEILSHTVLTTYKHVALYNFRQ